MKNLSLIASLALSLILAQGSLPLRIAQQTQPVNLYLRAGVFDPLQNESAVKSSVPLTSDQSGLYLVQFPGPVLDEWHAAMQQSGLQVVSYIPDYAYLVWGSQAQISGSSSLSAPEAMPYLAQGAPLRWSGAYLPEYSLAPSLSEARQTPSTEIDVLVQVYDHPAAAQVVAEIEAAALSVFRPAQLLLSNHTLGVRVTSAQLDWLAGLPGVVNIEPRPDYQKLDEIQGQIMAGNLLANGAAPSGPGYLGWLIGRGFSTNPNDYPIVDVTDDGIDNGSATPAHPDFYLLGSTANADRLAYNANWTNSDSTADGLGGHGTINAAIVAGYNDRSGAAFEDGAGYNYGLGVNPFGRVAGSKVFNNAGNWDLFGNSLDTLLSNTYAQGGRIGSYSWGAGTNGLYTIDDQSFDALARDARSEVAGNQQMTLVVAAGNNGSAASTTTSPGNAKNVITVGASESYRPGWVDGCGVGTSGADNAQDIISFSSRGPTFDGRIKPDLVAPGTHIIGAATQAAGYNASGVCNKYYPAGQTLYAASSGTSHATPAVAGAASLLHRYYAVNYGGASPSPAMVKAYLTNSARYLTGVSANDALPSTRQGLGLVNLDRAFDGVSRVMVDQSQLLSATGQVYTLQAGVVDPSRPLRVSLAWSDAPGVPYAAAAYVNNLDLEVEIGGLIYKGNVFSGGVSVSGGAADPRNNLESVFFAPGKSGSLVVRVRATNIAGDGLPGNGDATDQDFALVIYNSSMQPGRLQGVVTAGGASLAGATLDVRGPQQVVTQSLANGVYSLPLPNGVYTATAWKYGYLPQTYTNLSVSTGLITARDFNLSAAPQHALGGCVRDQATNEGLYADLVLKDAYGSTLAQTSVTRENPCYNLTPYAGSYTLNVTSLLHQPAQASVQLSSAVTQDFSLVATTTDGMIRGAITDQVDGLPLGGALVTANPGGYQAQTAGDGSYNLQLPPGLYSLALSAPLYVPFNEQNVIVTQSNLTQKSYALTSPHLALSSSQAYLLLGSQGIIDLTLTISNTAASVLEFQIAEASGTPRVPGEVTWLSVSPLNGSLPGGASQSLDIQIDAAQIPFASGQVALRFLNNDPRRQPYQDYVLTILRNPVFLPLVRR